MSSRLQTLPSNEYWKEPSLRTLSAFFLGGLFLLSIYYIIKTPALQTLFTVIGRLFSSPHSRRSSEPEGLEEDADEKIRLRQWIEEAFLGPSENLDPKNLVLTLNIFATNASAALAGSTFTYFTGQDALCTFSIAWGQLAAEMIRIVGFIRLSLDIRELGARQWEMYLTWFYVIACAAVMMVNTVFAPGLLRTSYQFQGLALCYKQHFIQVELLQSLLNVLFELYAVIRIGFLLVPAFLQPRHKFAALRDMRIGKALALLILDLTVVAPNAVPLNIAADFIPFALLAIVVLAAFNYEQARIVSTLTRVDSIPSTRMMRIFQGGSSSTIGGVRTPTSVRSLRRGSTAFSRHTTNRQRRSLDVPPFPPGIEQGSRRRGLKELDIATANAAPISPAPSTRRRGYSSAVAGYSRRGESSRRRSIEITAATETQEMMNRKVVMTQFGGSIESYSEFPAPPKELPPVPTVQVTDAEGISGVNNMASSAPRGDRSRASSVVYLKRPYDPAKDIPDSSSKSQRHGSTHLSPMASSASGWPKREDSLSIIQEVSPIRVGGGQHSASKSPSKSTFGVKSRYSRVRSRVDSSSRQKRRSSVDFGKITPYILDEEEDYSGPPSPSTAPVSREAIGPVVDMPSPRLLDPDREAVATGVASSSAGPMGGGSRIRFGARPMRSALYEGGEIEESMPRGMLLSTPQRVLYDKLE